MADRRFPGLRPIPTPNFRRVSASTAPPHCRPPRHRLGWYQRSCVLRKGLTLFRMSAKAEVFTSMSALTPESGHSAGPKADIDGILDWLHSLLFDDTKRRRPFQEFKQIRCSIWGFRGRADRANEHCIKLNLGRQRSGKLDTRSGERLSDTDNGQPPSRTRACRFGPRKRTFDLDRAAAMANSRRGEPTTHPVRTNDLRYALQ